MEEGGIGELGGSDRPGGKEVGMAANLVAGK